jgi:N-acetylmuramoyl-L-alanine amidase/Putative peptidoglycan binding domain
MKICISAGHATDVRGMVGPSPWGLEEVDEARRVTARVGELLNAGGVPTKTWWDDVSQTQDENLERICDWHNSQQRDIDVSIHFNSADPPGHGCEVFYATAHDLAETIVDKVCAASGLTNRGPKTGNLYFLSHTEKPAVLIEVCFGNHQGDCETYRRAFEPICLAIAEGLAGHELGSAPGRPDRPEPPPGPQGAGPTLGLGDQGDDVVELQTKLGVLIADGDFGSITETWVQAFQRACGLSADGIVGPATWEQVDALVHRLRVGEEPLPLGLAQKIWTMAQQSEIADYSWPGRGIAPPGYVPGIALCFAHAMTRSGEAVAVMSRAQSSPDLDALAWYEPEFRQAGMSNKKPGLDTLRHLFVMMMGLGPRESSGKYFEGRDLSAENVASDTCEAGLFQTSWNIKAGSSAIPPLLGEFWTNPHGFLNEFREGLAPTSSNLNSYGSGDGVRYQWLSRFCPLFHVLVTGVGMRTLRQHWGPINRREVTIKREADTLLQDVQSLVDDEGASA